MSLCIKYKGNYFQFCDVQGDGNCLYSALSLSPEINGNTGDEARRNLMNALREDVIMNGNARELYNTFGNQDTFLEWIEYHERQGNWGGFFVSVMFSYINNVNIETISNMPGGLVSSSTYVFLKIDRSPSTPTIYLYHHIYTNPSLPSHNCNHYGYLNHIKHPSRMDKSLVYEGNTPAIPLANSKDKPIVVKEDNSIDNSTNINININNNNDVSLDLSSIDRLFKNIKKEKEKKNKNNIDSHHFYNPNDNMSKIDTTDPFIDDSSSEEEHIIRKKKRGRPKKKKKEKPSITHDNITNYFKKRKVIKKYVKPKKMNSKVFAKLSNSQKKEEKKRYKDSIIYNYTEFMTSNRDQYLRLQMQLKSNEEFEKDVKNKKELSDDMQSCIDSCFTSEDVEMHNTIRDEGINGRCRHQLTWRQRSCIVMFYLHPRLGDRNPSLVSSIYKIPRSTILNWISGRCFIPKWICFVRELTIQDVISSIPSRHQATYSNRYRASIGTPFEMKISTVSLKSYEAKASKSKIFEVHNNNKGKSHQKSDDNVYITTLAKRISNSDKVSKYHYVKTYILDKVTSSWKEGIPLTKLTLYRLILDKFLESNCQFSMNVLQCKNYPNSLHKYVGRVLKQIGYADRKKTISQKIPMNWDTIAREGARDVRKFFRDKKVDVVLAGDEFFQQFHSDCGKVIVPRGTKRVGSATKLGDTKEGCTIMVTMALEGSKLLAPTIIFNGVFGGTLMRRWSSFRDAQVLFTENHWQTEATMKLYIHLIKLTFADKENIGLIIDKASMHDNTGLLNYVEENNFNRPFIHVAFITENLTSVYSPPDLIVIKNIKANLRRNYDRVLVEKRKKLGETVRVSREEVVSMAISAFNEVNDANEFDPYVRRGFDACGLNPFAKDTRAFEEHLSSLTENKIYEALIDKNFTRDMD